jgi:hypothetical protein
MYNMGIVYSNEIEGWLMNCKLVEMCPDRLFFSWGLVPSDGPLPRLLVIDDGLGISQLPELRFREEVGRVVDC